MTVSEPRPVFSQKHARQVTNPEQSFGAMPKPKLFIPGPVDISAATYEAMCSEMIGHRGKDFESLYASIQPGLQKIAGTERPVFLSTSSAWGVMEGAIRNLVQKKVLNLCCGAFSDKWFDVSLRCGKQAEKIQLTRLYQNELIVRLQIVSFSAPRRRCLALR